MFQAEWPHSACTSLGLAKLRRELKVKPLSGLCSSRVCYMALSSASSRTHNPRESAHLSRAAQDTRRHRQELGYAQVNSRYRSKDHPMSPKASIHGRAATPIPTTTRPPPPSPHTRYTHKYARLCACLYAAIRTYARARVCVSVFICVCVRLCVCARGCVC